MFELILKQSNTVNGMVAQGCACHMCYDSIAPNVGGGTTDDGGYLTPPTVYAGNDQNITAVLTTITLVGTITQGSKPITSRLWEFVSGPSTPVINDPTSATTTVSNLIGSGTYVFRLSASDGTLTATDSITILKPAYVEPMVFAGDDRSIDAPNASIDLLATVTAGSGVISSILWILVSGPNTPTIQTSGSAGTTVTGLIPGTYVFRVTATDVNGHSAQDDVAVAVADEVAFVSPGVNAGADLIINYPASSSANLAGAEIPGTDPIVARLWTKVSGPNTPTFTLPNALATAVTGLTVGDYVFRLTVTDASNHSAQDTVSVTVNEVAVPIAPRVFYGYNTDGVLPTLNQVLASPYYVDIANGGAVTCNFGQFPFGELFYWVYFPAGQPDPTTWDDTQDSGMEVGPNGVFGAPTILAPGKIIITRYGTYIPYNSTFNH